jgi:predicted component of type VI protein secretion system
MRGVPALAAAVPFRLMVSNMPPQLLALTDGPSILLDKPILLLGRHQECDIQLVSRKVSRRHCCIAQVGDHLVVRDLGSTNGIRVNGVRVVEGQLKPGDELTIGNYRYEVRWEALEPPPASRVPRKAAVRRELQPEPAMDDALLESCDQPIALPEGPSRAGAKAGRPGGHPHPPDDVRHTEAGGRSQSLILPENIELAPSSDARQPNADRPPAP